MSARETEYKEAMTEKHHIYETRHKFFNFTILINAAFSAGVFNFVKTEGERVGLSLLAGVVTLVMTLMAIRSNRYLKEVDNFIIELETILGFELVTKTRARMPSGLTSTNYFFICYWLVAISWFSFAAYQLFF